jgi:hypothetical protein
MSENAHAWILPPTAIAAKMVKSISFLQSGFKNFMRLRIFTSLLVGWLKDLRSVER